eukprot:TRINITY_DN18455_c0_g1_i1.p1 TRINITY_DN18455_c0_g1~~TRINITY_DN18455_c0_g1_i1.p1  ORF type:complete len:468 (+),score=87.92 TRINITY_DN18455_c0_g1_i1:39-1406(+)
MESRCPLEIEDCSKRRSPVDLLGHVAIAAAASPQRAVRGIAAAVAAVASPCRLRSISDCEVDGSADWQDAVINSFTSQQEGDDDDAGDMSADPTTSPLQSAPRGGAPPWLRSFALPFALLCGALAGIIPLCAVAFFQLLGDSDTPAPAPLPQAPPGVPPQQVGWGSQWGGWLSMSQPFGAGSGLAGNTGQLMVGDASDGQLLGAVEALRNDMHRQVASQKAVEASIASRMQRLEASVSSAASVAAASASSLFGRRSTEEDRSSLDGLGVDWLAWSAGAEIDASYTSPGIGRGIVGRAARVAASVLPRYRASLGNVSHPPEVVLAADAAPPARCFTFRGVGTIAVRLRGTAVLTHIAVENVPAWASVKPRAAPRHFEVRVRTPGAPSGSGFGAPLGAFEYVLDGGRVQVFSLGGAGVAAEAVQFTFTGNWGEDFTAVCRLRALGPAIAAAPVVEEL